MWSIKLKIQIWNHFLPFNYLFIFRNEIPHFVNLLIFIKLCYTISSQFSFNSKWAKKKWMNEWINKSKFWILILPHKLLEQEHLLFCLNIKSRTIVSCELILVGEFYFIFLSVTIIIIRGVLVGPFPNVSRTCMCLCRSHP